MIPGLIRVEVLLDEDKYPAQSSTGPIPVDLTFGEEAFLPPYNQTHYRYDGLDMRIVEWYSGGMQLSTVRHSCNMQRIMVIDNPTNFSKSLIYHSTNNKQRQLAGKREETFTKANTLLGQLNTIRKQAQNEIPR